MKVRRHTAVMFTDIVGYIALRESDEIKAADMLIKNRELHRQSIIKHHGELIKEVDDGVLCSFSLSSDAVRCAVEIQKRAKDEQIPLTMGIHQGELIFKSIDVFGKAIDIASRLQEIGEEGCITISDTVYKEVRFKKGFRADYIGKRTLENVDEPVKIYRVMCSNGDSNQEHLITKIKRNRHILPYIIILILFLVLAIAFLWSILSWPRPDFHKTDENESSSAMSMPY